MKKMSEEFSRSLFCSNIFMWFHTGGEKYIKKILEKLYFSLGFICGKTFENCIFTPERMSFLLSDYSPPQYQFHT